MKRHRFGIEYLEHSLQNTQGAHSFARCSRKALTRRSQGAQTFAPTSSWARAYKTCNVLTIPKVLNYFFAKLSAIRIPICALRRNVCDRTLPANNLRLASIRILILYNFNNRPTSNFVT